MTYLDQVVSELLRKWTPGIITERYCTKDLTIDVDGKQIEFQKDRIFMVPVYGIHHDPKYYPEPDKFDPERFNEDNKKNLNLNAYIPFGIGKNKKITCQ